MLLATLLEVSLRDLAEKCIQAILSRAFSRLRKYVAGDWDEQNYKEMLQQDSIEDNFEDKRSVEEELLIDMVKEEERGMLPFVPSDPEVSRDGNGQEDAPIITVNDETETRSGAVGESVIQFSRDDMSIIPWEARIQGVEELAENEPHSEESSEDSDDAEETERKILPHVPNEPEVSVRETVPKPLPTDNVTTQRKVRRTEPNAQTDGRESTEVTNRGGRRRKEVPNVQGNVVKNTGHGLEGAQGAASDKEPGRQLVQGAVGSFPLNNSNINVTRTGQQEQTPEGAVGSNTLATSATKSVSSMSNDPGTRHKKVPLTKRAFTHSDEDEDRDKLVLVQPVGDDGVDEPCTPEELPSTVEEKWDDGPAPVVPSQIQYIAAENIPQFETTSLSDPYFFTVTARGCRVKAPYCRLYCPPEAVQEPIDLQMRPEYYPQDELAGGGIFITPYIHFSSTAGGIRFLKDVKLSIYTSYSANSPEDLVMVKMIEKVGNGVFDTGITTLLSSEQGNDEEKNFVHFKCRQFCAIAGHVPQNLLVRTNRRYYSAAYIGKGESRDLAILHLFLYDDMEILRQENLQLLRNKNVALNPECITIRYPHKLFIEFYGGQLASLRPQNTMVPLETFYHTKMDEKYQFAIRWKPGESSQQLPMSYQMYLVDGLNRRGLFRHKAFFPVRNFV